MFWAAFELLYAGMQIKNHPPHKASVIVNISVIGVAIVVISVYLFLMHTGHGFRARVGMSSEALDALRKPEYADARQRVGWFLIDTQRQPCEDQAWLWLGNMYGGGSGNNLALVHSVNSVPKTPVIEAFRFWPVSGGWWLAYQNPKKYHSQTWQPDSCVPGEEVETHDQGMNFILVTLPD